MFAQFFFLLLHLLAIEVGRGIALPHQAQVIGRDAALKTSYDFVIIGGGTSGLTVADRLTENPNSE
jgi:ribulose 1,5-bisphosphate synthetase/thiazole synthase